MKVHSEDVGVSILKFFSVFLFFLAVIVPPDTSFSSERIPIHVRIIIVGAQSEAEDILTQVKNGKLFASLAKERSIDEKTREKYGEIQENEVKDLAEPLKKAASRLGDGEVSGIVKLEDNTYALVQVIDLQYYRRGAKAFRSRDYRTAEASLLKHVAINPDAVKARTMLGKIYQERKEDSKAETMYKEAISFNPQYEEAYVKLGELYLRGGQHVKARVLYEEGLKHIPDSEALSKGREALESQIPKQDERVEKTVTIRIIITESKKDAEDIVNETKKGKLFLYLAKERSVDERTREEYGYLGEIDVNALSPPIRKGLSGLEEGQVSEMIRLENNRYAIIQKTSVRHYKEGEKAFINEDFVTAETKLLKHIDLNPDAVKARVMLGKIYEDRKEYEKAEGMYTKALVFSPKTVLIYERLARLYISQGRILKAKEVYEAGLRQVPASHALAEGLEMTDILLIGERRELN